MSNRSVIAGKQIVYKSIKLRKRVSKAPLFVCIFYEKSGNVVEVIEDGMLFSIFSAILAGRALTLISILPFSKSYGSAMYLAIPRLISKGIVDLALLRTYRLTVIDHCILFGTSRIVRKSELVQRVLSVLSLFIVVALFYRINIRICIMKILRISNSKSVINI